MRLLFPEFLKYFVTASELFVSKSIVCIVGKTIFLLQ